MPWCHFKYSQQSFTSNENGRSPVPAMAELEKEAEGNFLRSERHRAGCLCFGRNFWGFGKPQCLEKRFQTPGCPDWITSFWGHDYSPWKILNASFSTHCKCLGFLSCFFCPRSAHKASSSRWGQLLRASPGFKGTSKQEPPPLFRAPQALGRDTSLSWPWEWREKEVVLGWPLPGCNPEPRICVQGVS